MLVSLPVAPLPSKRLVPFCSNSDARWLLQFGGKDEGAYKTFVLYLGAANYIFCCSLGWENSAAAFKCAPCLYFIPCAHCVNILALYGCILLYDRVLAIRKFIHGRLPPWLNGPRHIANSFLVASYLHGQRRRHLQSCASIVRSHLTGISGRLRRALLSLRDVTIPLFEAQVIMLVSSGFSTLADISYRGCIDGRPRGIPPEGRTLTLFLLMGMTILR